MASPPHTSSRSPTPDHNIAMNIINHIWTSLDLPSHALDSVYLTGQGHILPSSFRIADLAQASIACSALAASLVDSERERKSHADEKKRIRTITVDRVHACCEFKSEHLYTLDGMPAESAWGVLGGLHKAKDGWVRIHDSFPNHRRAAAEVLGLGNGGSVNRGEVSAAVAEWSALELERRAQQSKAVIYALRSYREWDALPQAQVLPDAPVSLQRVSESGPRGFPAWINSARGGQCLSGLRVLDLSRVIAAPVAGKTLAAHGADVLWITSPNLPTLPALDVDVQRGKRSVQLDLDSASDREKLCELVSECDVFLQSYRPGSLEKRGFGIEDLVKMKPGIIVANLSAWGTEGPWKSERGFDSIVQTVSGMNISEAEQYGDGSPAKPLPCQALDHAAGYMLATGISAAVWRRAQDGGSWVVKVSLAGAGKYLRSLGQVEGRRGFEDEVKMPEHLVTEEMMEARMCARGTLKALSHSATVEGKRVGWGRMLGSFGGDEARWL